MEYGPRALGNRSILYQATDKDAKEKLNKCLARNEFMPFAPIVLDEYADSCFHNLEGAGQSARFMTMTFNCTAFMKKKCPGAVHTDGTARPQILSKNENPSMHALLSSYHSITKIPVLINTSFNIHDEPIVCSPKDAILTFKKSNIDYLAIGNYLVKAQ